MTRSTDSEILKAISDVDAKTKVLEVQKENLQEWLTRVESKVDRVAEVVTGLRIRVAVLVMGSSFVSAVMTTIVGGYIKKLIGGE